MTKGETETVGSSKTVTLNFENTGVNNLIQRAQAQLERFKMCESFGMWEFCSYFMDRGRLFLRLGVTRCVMVIYVPLYCFETFIWNLSF